MYLLAGLNGACFGGLAVIAGAVTYKLAEEKSESTRLWLTLCAAIAVTSFSNVTLSIIIALFS